MLPCMSVPPPRCFQNYFYFIFFSVLSVQQTKQWQKNFLQLALCVGIAVNGMKETICGIILKFPHNQPNMQETESTRRGHNLSNGLPGCINFSVFRTFPFFGFMCLDLATLRGGGVSHDQRQMPSRPIHTEHVRRKGLFTPETIDGRIDEFVHELNQCTVPCGSVHT